MTTISPSRTYLLVVIKYGIYQHEIVKLPESKHLNLPPNQPMVNNSDIAEFCYRESSFNPGYVVICSAMEVAGLKEIV